MKQIKLERENLAELKEYKARAVQEIEAIIDVVNTLNPNSVNKEKALDESKWSMEKVSPKSRRGSVSIKVGENKSKKETARLLTYLKDKLGDCQATTDDEKEAINLAKGRIDLLAFQAASKIAEVIAIDYLTKVQNEINDLTENNQLNVNVKEKVDNHMQFIKNRVEEFSLDFDKNGFKEYTSAEVGIQRSETLQHYDKAIGSMNKLVKEKGINDSELINNLKNSKEIFKNKSAINFDLPTKGTTKKNARTKATFFCSVGSLTTGVAATGCLALSSAGVTAPLGLPMAGILGITSVALGGAAFTMTAANSAENYLLYKVSPTTGEKVSLVLGTASLGMGGVGVTGVTSAIGTTAAEIGNVSSHLFTSGKNTISSVSLTNTVIGYPSQKKLKNALNEVKNNEVKNNEVKNNEVKNDMEDRIALSM